MFGEKLKALREDAGLYQKELGDVLNVTSQTVSGWEINRTTPDYDMLKKIANYFGVSIDYLLGNISNKNNVEEEMKILRQLLIENGYLSPGEDLTKKELDNLMKFVKANKAFLKGNK